VYPDEMGGYCTSEAAAGYPAGAGEWILGYKELSVVAGGYGAYGEYSGYPGGSLGADAA
jgi:hypothetical protein